MGGGWCEEEPCGPWGARVQALMEALGWRVEDAGDGFGCSGPKLQRIRFGGRADAGFVRRLEMLEAVNRGRLELWRARGEWDRARRKYGARSAEAKGCQARVEELATVVNREAEQKSRPADLRAVGRVLGGKGAGAARAARIVLPAAVFRGVHAGADSKVGAGRSAVGGRRSEEID